MPWVFHLSQGFSIKDDPDNAEISGQVEAGVTKLKF